MEAPFRSGLHHVTLITRRVQANVDFYVGFLGLSLVKRTGGFEDNTQLHLFYGDPQGSPGSLVTFFAWEDGASGRVGTGQVSEIAFAVPAATMGDWLTRALTHRVPVEGPAREMGEPVLRLKDPDGIIVKLVGRDLPDPRPQSVGPLRAITLLTDTPEETARFLTRFGYRPGPRQGSIQRLVSETDAVDVRDATGYVPGVPGTGTADHVAFRAPDVAAVEAAEDALRAYNRSPTTVHDRKYFTSLYVREPGGALLELATDGPGFALDEPAGHLGETLFVPHAEPERAEDLKLLLPQFALPGQPRIPLRDLPFVHRFHVPETPDGSTLVLLHGTGGDEADLMPLARRAEPHATLLGVRGRAHEEGTTRWFRRIAGDVVDQADIAAEAEAFAAFVTGAAESFGLDRDATTFLGLSNGANFLAAFMGLYPGLVRRAVLIRPMLVLDPPPAPDLSGVDVLMLVGAQDPFAARAPALAAWLNAAGARLETRTLPAGHGLVPEDRAAIAEWLVLRT